MNPCEQKKTDLLQARQQEGLQAFIAGVGAHLTDVVEEGRPQLPVAVIQEGDHCRQQEVIAFPALNHHQGCSCNRPR